MHMHITGAYGGSLADIAVWKRKGKQARLQYYNPANHRLLEVSLPGDSWQPLIATTGYPIAHENDPPREPGEFDNICNHAAGIDLRVIDAAGRGHDFDADYCNGGPAMDMAKALMSTAFDTLPECRWISPNIQDELVFRLQACTLARGNLHSAGDALNWLYGQTHPIGESWAVWSLEALLNDKVIASWAGRPEMHDCERIKAAIDADFSDAQIRIDWVTGISDRLVGVDVIGKITAHEDGGKDKRVALHLTLARAPESKFELVRITGLSTTVLPAPNLHWRGIGKAANGAR